MNPEELLTHADFVRGLARSLVLDEHRAADITQETWLAALKHPPDAGKPLRAWLARVTRNFARIMHRSEQSRKARERAVQSRSAVPGPDDIPTPEDIAAREEIRRRMVDAVLDLEEPYRTAVILRYYEDHTPTEAAARLGVPLETVKTRLKRSLTRLRACLDRAYGGDRAAWGLAAAPLAGVHLCKTAAAAAPAASATLPGALIMGTKTKIGLSVAAVLVATITLWQLFIAEETPKVPLSDVANETPARQEAATVIPMETEPAAVAEGGDADVRETPVRTPVLPDRAAGRYATWKGVVRDISGTALKGAYGRTTRVTGNCREVLHPDRDEGKNLFFDCDEAGCFEHGGIAPGRYGIRIYHDSIAWLDCGEVVFREPGLVEKDLCIPPEAGAVVSGVVMDLATGQPLRRDRVGVGVFNPNIKGQAPIADVDPENGTFHFHCLPPVTLDLIVVGPGLHQRYYPGMVHAEAGRVYEGLVLEVPLLGELLLVLDGFGKEERKKLDIHLTPEKGRKMPIPFNYFKPDEAMPITTGKVVAEFGLEGLGKVTRSAEVKAGEVTEMMILRSDLDRGTEATFTLRGSLKGADESPVSGAVLKFTTYMEGRTKISFESVTDEEGEFTVERFRAGLWDIQCLLCRGGAAVLEGMRSRSASFPEHPIRMVYFRGILVPEDPPESYRMDLTVPGGSVKGMVYDQVTGLPVSDEIMGIRGGVTEKNNMANWLRSNSAVWRGAGPFEVAGISPGEYIFGVMASGYEMYLSEPFSLAEGQILDLGKIMLEPSGMVDLEVVGPSGDPLLLYTITCEGRELGHTTGDSMRLPGGKMRYWTLPLGSATLKITARGYKDQEITVETEPGRPVPVRVILEKEWDGKS